MYSVWINRRKKVKEKRRKQSTRIVKLELERFSSLVDEDKVIEKMHSFELSLEFLFYHLLLLSGQKWFSWKEANSIRVDSATEILLLEQAQDTNYSSIDAELLFQQFIYEE